MCYQKTNLNKLAQQSLMKNKIWFVKLGHENKVEKT